MPVTAATVVQRAVPVELKTFGTVEAAATVNVKALVTEVLRTVHFRKGQYVKKGDPLFTLETRTFDAALRQAEAKQKQSEAGLKQAEANLRQSQANLKQAQANLARDKVHLETAGKELTRQEALLKERVASQSDYDKVKADADALAETVRADEAAVQGLEASVDGLEASVQAYAAAGQAEKAAVDNARIQLEYCRILSPVDARAGNILVNEGNLIKAGDAVLVSLHQVQPIEVFFSVPEAELPRVKRYMAEGKVMVQAEIPKDPGPPEAGELTFVDNAVDQASGTIRLGAVFANSQERLWPGLYVNVAVALTVQKDALVVPAQAVQTGQGHKYVVVIKPDSTVENRPVIVRRINEQEVVAEKGVQAGEQVVTDGHLRIAPGVKVTIRTEVERKGTLPKAGSQKASPQGPASRGAQS